MSGLAAFDGVYVAPGATHPLRAGGAEPFGFRSTVDWERDQPEVVP
jgi:hypothetical protein